MGYNSVTTDIKGLPSFIQLLSPKSAKSHEILRKFDLLIPVQGHPRSSILAPPKSAYVTSY